MKTGGNNSLVEFFYSKTIKRLCFLWICCWLGTVSSAFAKSNINPDDPVGFFTTFADKMLGSTFDFGVTNIPVYVNGVFVYSPAIQRLLQLSANVGDATTTNFFPSVFRPLFVQDGSNNIFICGYQLVTNVTGLGDPLLSQPHKITELSSLSPTGSIITDANGPVNVYDVPWIIGARKGFPNFNKLGSESVIQITRRMQVRRQEPPTGAPAVLLATNQMYVFSIQNNLGVECWNSYAMAYPNPVQIMVRDSISMLLTNDAGTPPVPVTGIPATFVLSTNIAVNSWPGYAVGYPNSFVIPVNQQSTFLPDDIYYSGTTPPGVQGFYLAAFNYGWESNNFSFDLPNFGLLTTNQFQLVMLDTGGVSGGGPYHVIDYVQLSGPSSSRNLNSVFQTNDAAYNYANMWSLAVNGSGLPVGVANQWNTAMGWYGINGSYWKNPVTGATATGSTIQDEINGFCKFLGLASPYGNTVSDPALAKYYTNNVVVLPYMPTATIIDYTGWQANDPLVHYQVTDLASTTTENSTLFQGIYKLPDPAIIPTPNYTKPNERYQPWGVAAPAMLQSAQYNFTDPFNLIYKDPLVLNPDHWAFPTNLLDSLALLGQVHRGTPWQTIYLKARDVLHDNVNVVYPSRGTNTWMAWTGDYDVADAALTAPLQDRQLVDLLISLLSTNDPTQLFSVNDPNFSDWLSLLDGLIVYSNSLPNAYAFTVPQFDVSVMTSNSMQAAIMADGVLQTKSLFASQQFNSIGDVCAVFSLSENSPWLNTNSTVGRNGPSQIKYGITDFAYELIPAQLLSLLRPDSIGTASLSEGVWNLKFSGSAGYAYELQSSTNLVDWSIVSTNYPVRGFLSIPIPAPPGSALKFYRSVLLP